MTGQCTDGIVHREDSKLEVEDMEHCKKCGAELPIDQHQAYDGEGRPMNFTIDGWQSIELCPDCWVEPQLEKLADECMERYAGELAEVLARVR